MQVSIPGPLLLESGALLTELPGAPILLFLEFCCEIYVKTFERRDSLKLNSIGKSYDRTKVND